MSPLSSTADEQALNLALEDIRAKLIYYRAITEKYGCREPEAGLTTSCEQQLEALQHVAATRSGEDPDYPAPACARGRLESLETAVAKEIASFDLYDRLLQEDLNPQLRDTLCRIQAAVYQHHLPALRREIDCVQAADPMVLIEEVKEIIHDRDPAQWARLFSGRQGALLGGALLGAGAFWLAKDQLNRKTEKE